jgi:transcriptional regulator with XRE-family HTH domain
MTFGKKLKELRLAAGLTLAAVAEATKIGLPTVKDYKGDRRTPSLQNAQRLANALGVDCTAFNGCQFQHAQQRQPGMAGGPSMAAVAQTAGMPPKGKKAKGK